MSDFIKAADRLALPIGESICTLGESHPVNVGGCDVAALLGNCREDLGRAKTFEDGRIVRVEEKMINREIDRLRCVNELPCRFPRQDIGAGAAMLRQKACKFAALNVEIEALEHYAVTVIAVTLELDAGLPLRDP